MHNRQFDWFIYLDVFIRKSNILFKGFTPNYSIPAEASEIHKRRILRDLNYLCPSNTFEVEEDIHTQKIAAYNLL